MTEMVLPITYAVKPSLERGYAVTVELSFGRDYLLERAQETPLVHGDVPTAKIISLFAHRIAKDLMAYMLEIPDDDVRLSSDAEPIFDALYAVWQDWADERAAAKGADA